MGCASGVMAPGMDGVWMAVYGGALCDWGILVNRVLGVGVQLVSIFAEYEYRVFIMQVKV